MAAFGQMILTNRGRVLQAKAQTGVALQFTAIKIGDGQLAGQSIPTLTGLINLKMTLGIGKMQVRPDGKAVIGTKISNEGLSAGFYFREIGIFAIDPDIGEILYCYANAGAAGDYIPAGGGGDLFERYVDVIVIVQNAANVSATIDESLAFTSLTDFNAHKNATTLDHPDGSVTTPKIAAKAVTAAKLADNTVGSGQLAAGAVTDTVIGNRTIDDTVTAATGADTPTRLWSKIANMIKRITGKANWFTAPAVTLEDANTHINSTVGAHGATSAATGNTLVQRDAIGRTSLTQLIVSDSTAPIIDMYEQDANKRYLIVVDGGKLDIREDSTGVGPSFYIAPGKKVYTASNTLDDGGGTALFGNPLYGYIRLTSGASGVYIQGLNGALDGSSRPIYLTGANGASGTVGIVGELSMTGVINLAGGGQLGDDGISTFIKANADQFHVINEGNSAYILRASPTMFQWNGLDIINNGGGQTINGPLTLTGPLVAHPAHNMVSLGGSVYNQFTNGSGGVGWQNPAGTIILYGNNAGAITTINNILDDGAGVARFGKTAGGTYNGNIILGPSDQLPSLQFYSGPTIKAQIMAGMLNGEVYLDATNFFFRNAPNSGATVLLIESSGQIKTLKNTLDDGEGRIYAANTIYITGPAAAGSWSPALNFSSGGNAAYLQKDSAGRFKFYSDGSGAGMEVFTIDSVGGVFTPRNVLDNGSGVILTSGGVEATGFVLARNGSNLDQRVVMQYENDRGEIQAVHDGVTYKDLVLNVAGGSVLTRNNLLDDSNGNALFGNPANGYIRLASNADAMYIQGMNATQDGTKKLRLTGAFGNPGTIETYHNVLDDGNGGATVKKLTISAASGTPPIVVSSPTKVDNLNADLLEGFHADTVSTANTIAVRDNNNFIRAGTFVSNTEGFPPLQVMSTFVVSNLNADMVDGIHGDIIAKTDMWGNTFLGKQTFDLNGIYFMEVKVPDDGYRAYRFTSTGGTKEDITWARDSFNNHALRIEREGVNGFTPLTLLRLDTNGDAAIGGQLQLLNSTQIYQTLYQGSGSPEGVVTAPIGAIYRRLDGGGNTTLYVKELGNGNGGWVAK
jgi:hypothetical protein